MKGLLVHVYRAALGDCTNGGLTAKHATAVLIKNGQEIGPFEPSENLPVLYLAKWMGRVIAVPANLEVEVPEIPGAGTGNTIYHLNGWMFGGNFVHSSDDRMPGRAPIFVYDRREF